MAQSRVDKIGRIAEILHRRVTNAERLIAALAAGAMDDDEKEEIMALLLDEFVAALDYDSEPTAYGRQVDDLIGWVADQQPQD